MYTHIHIYIYTYVYTYTYMCMRVTDEFFDQVCIYIYIYIYVHTYTYIQAFNVFNGSKEHTNGSNKTKMDQTKLKWIKQN